MHRDLFAGKDSHHGNAVQRPPLPDPQIPRHVPNGPRRGIGAHPSAVNRYVTGNRVPSIEVTERICAALGVGPEVFAESLSAFSAKQLADFCRENAPYYTADQKLEIVKALLG